MFAVRQFIRDHSSETTMDDLRFDRRRPRNVHRPGASIGGPGRSFRCRWTVEPAPRSVMTTEADVRRRRIHACRRQRCVAGDICRSVDFDRLARARNPPKHELGTEQIEY